LLDSSEIDRLVKSELARMDDERLRAAILALLVPPRREDRAWNYGPVGATFPCWIVLEHLPSNTGIAYCEQGFGPGDPWGLLFLTGRRLSMGMESQWFVTLEDAFRQSMACDIPPPPGYEVASANLI
jgi:hypothetical protein